jgi:uncharacterized membrane protein
MSRKLMSNKAPLVALALAVVVIVPNVSQAAYLRGQPIYVRNTTSRPISVAAMYQPPGTNGFVTNGFWQVAPGQSMRILYNTNRWIYFYARDDNGNVWAGNATTAVVNGETLKMGQYDTGMCFDPWTITFGP